jgi:hypothetical protein
MALKENGGYLTGKQPGGEAGDKRVGAVWHTQASGIHKRRPQIGPLFLRRESPAPASHNTTQSRYVPPGSSA